MLSEEVDVVSLIQGLRVGQFIAKLILNKHQRALVTSFKKYQIDDLRQTELTDNDKGVESLNDSGSVLLSDAQSSGI